MNVDFNIHKKQWILGLEFSFGYIWSFYINLGPFSVGVFQINGEE
jgi:hypothetical protein